MQLVIEEFERPKAELLKAIEDTAVRYLVIFDTMFTCDHSSCAYEL
jgi:hypothetical protein